LNPGKRVDLNAAPAILQTMRAAILMIAALETALSARRDLLLDILALRHQLAVLSR
jgi:hypothetical protein